MRILSGTRSWSSLECSGRHRWSRTDWGLLHIHCCLHREERGGKVQTRVKLQTWYKGWLWPRFGCAESFSNPGVSTLVSKNRAGHHAPLVQIISVCMCLRIKSLTSWFNLRPEEVTLNIWVWELILDLDRKRKLNSISTCLLFLEKGRKWASSLDYFVKQHERVWLLWLESMQIWIWSHSLKCVVTTIKAERDVISKRRLLNVWSWIFIVSWDFFLKCVPSFRSPFGQTVNIWDIL